MTHARPRVIGSYNLKGGVGKTTTAEAGGEIIVSLGHQLLIFDTDSQGHIGNLINWKLIPPEQRFALADVICKGIPLLQAMYQARRGLWVVPAVVPVIPGEKIEPKDAEEEQQDPMVAATAFILLNKAKEIMVERFDDLVAALAPPPERVFPWQQETVLRIKTLEPPPRLTKLAEVLEKPKWLDFVIADFAPNPGVIGDSLLQIIDEIWSPILLEALAIQGLRDLIRHLDLLFARNPERKPKLTRIIPARVNHARDTSNLALGRLIRSWPHTVARVVHEDRHVTNAQFEQPPQTVWEYSRFSRPAKELLEIVLDYLHFEGEVASKPQCKDCAQIWAKAAPNR